MPILSVQLPQVLKYGGMDAVVWPNPAAGCGRLRLPARLAGIAALSAVALAASSCIVSEALFSELEDEPFELNPDDPFEITNRHIYEVNSGLDQAILKPVAIGYTRVMPDPVENCVGNILSNLGEPLRMFNHALMLDGQAAVDSYSRFLVNTTMGGLGCVDAADSMGIKKNEVDLGMVARRYDIFDHEPPFLMLPLLGPSTLDATAGSMIGNRIIDPVRDRHLFLHNGPEKQPTRSPGLSFVSFFKQSEVSFPNPYFTTDDSYLSGYAVLTGVHVRAQLLDTTDILDAAALDPYSFQRDAYVQRRQAQAEKLRRKKYPKLLYPYSIFSAGAD